MPKIRAEQLKDYSLNDLQIALNANIQQSKIAGQSDDPTGWISKGTVHVVESDPVWNGSQEGQIYFNKTTKEIKIGIADDPYYTLLNDVTNTANKWESYVIVKTGAEGQDWDTQNASIFVSSQEFQVDGSNLFVYLNGMLLQLGQDYTLVNTTTIKLTVVIGASDKVTFLIYNNSSLAMYASKNYVEKRVTTLTTSTLPTLAGATGNVSTIDLGSSTARFNNIWANDIHIGANSLYVNGKKVISDDVSNGMSFKTDTNENVAITTSGTGIVDLVSASQIRINGNILPEMTGATGIISTRTIGDESHRFAHVWADEVHVGASSLYVNGKQVISDVSETMTFSTEADKSMNIKTTGAGSISILSENQINANAAGGLEWKVPAVNPSKNIIFTNQSSSGNITFTSANQIVLNATDTVAANNLTITGNLTVNGTTTTVNSEQVTIKDNLITINSNQTGTPATTLVSGIDVERGDEGNYRFVFEEFTDTFKIGMVGQLQPVATREDTPVAGGVATWDDTNKKFITTAVKTGFNLATGTTAGTVATGDHLHTGVYATAAQGTKADAALPSASYTAADVQSKVQGMNFTTAPTIVSKSIVTVTSAAAFPTSPAPILGDMCYRTDLDELYFYQGAAWIQI